MLRWTGEDNKGVEVLGVRWLLGEHRQGKTTSTSVIYTKSAEEIGGLRIGRKLFQTTRYHKKRDRSKSTTRTAWS